MCNAMGTCVYHKSQVFRYLMRSKGSDFKEMKRIVLQWCLFLVCVLVSVVIIYWIVERICDSDAWTPYLDILTEEESLSSPPIIDPKRAVKDVIVELRDGVFNYAVGDKIYLTLQTYDYYGNFRSVGGDHIRVRLEDKTVNARSSGYVLDHGNGSYTGVLEALWKGKPYIFVEIIYSRYEITYLYELRKKLTTLRPMGAYFRNKEKEEFGECLPFRNGLNKSHGVCDMSSINGGMPWFCQKPTTSGITCKHFSWLVNYEHSQTEIENAVRRQFFGERIAQRMELQIIIRDKQQRTTKKDQQFCPDYDKRKLWHQRSPVGYFYNGKWILTHCKPALPANHPNCLSRKTIFLYGDSTVKQWYQELRTRFSCTNNHLYSIAVEEGLCENKAIELTMHFTHHNLPEDIINGKFGSQTLEGFVNLINEDTQPVFLIHLFSQYTYYHHNIYRERIKRLNNSIKLILNKRPDAMILFKGPHTFNGSYRGINDYYSYVYRLILIDELKKHHGRIVYLDFKDLSIAMTNKNLLPSPNIVKLMVDEMMAYIC